jgi:nucleotide-binding universal stress UspA family protein
MKDILLPTDFSDNANNALEYILPIAQKAGAEITLFNVAHMPPGNTTMHRNIRDILKKDSEQALLQLKNKIDPAYKDVEIHTISRYGNLIVQINTIARAANNMDLIVMGTQGASGIKELFFGSNTADVIEQVRACPVLAVPNKATYTGIKKIVFATNYSGNNVPALKELLSFSEFFNASIHMLHIRKTDKMNPVAEQFKKRIETELPQSAITFHEIQNEDILDGLDQFIASENIDMMAMVARKKGFFETYTSRSLVKKAACNTTIPLLTFHDKE